MTSVLKLIVVAGLAVSLAPACSLPDFDQQLEQLPEIAPATPPQGCLEDADCVGMGPDGGDLKCIRHLDADEEVGLCVAEDVVRAQIGGGGGPEGGEGEGVEGEGEGEEGEGEPVNPEICNDKDDDKDGEIDEGFALHESCDDLGVCKGGEWICHAGGGRICSVKPGQADSPAGDETCNRKDDDCDGAVDEGITLPGADGAELPLGSHCAAKGECGGGIVVCYLPGSPDAGTPCCSSDALCRGAEPDAELCDGIDNDCDGSTDEGFDVGIECDGEEACGKGTTVCALDLSTSCCTTKGGCEPLEPQEDGPVGEDEVCDEVDNDCDGAIDEGLGLGDPCGEGACAAGTRICTPESGEVVCSTSGDDIAEICNGIDDDCDGVTDNGIERLGEECGQGVCGGGLYVCDLEDEDGQDLLCSTAGQAGDEVCNGLDDDCDGVVDEEIGKGALCAGVGECGVGVQECDGAGGLRCSTDIGGVHYPNVEEVCNGLDDDCDGELPANEGDTDDDGDLDCVEDAACPDVEGAFADPTVGPSATELCDQIDNDCDGLTDEGFGLGDECGFGLCAGGETVCDPNDPTKLGVICDSFDEARPEICNGLDDDCDGEVDEGIERLGAECGKGVCGEGVYVCDLEDEDGQDLLCSTAGRAGDEVCNGFDDDCDDEVDEGCNDDGDAFCDQDFEVEEGFNCTPGDCDDDNPDVPRADLFEDLSTGTDDDCAGGVDRLEDDFEGETLRRGWTVLTGSAQIVDRQDDVGGRFLMLAPDGADNPIAQALAPVIAPAGFDVTVDLGLVDGNDNTFGGVMFGWKEDGTFGYVALHPPNEVWLGTFTDGLADPVEDRYDEGIRNGGFGPVTLRVRGDADGRVRVWVDGVRILDGEDMSVQGRVGLFSQGTQVEFDNLQIRRP